MKILKPLENKENIEVPTNWLNKMVLLAGAMQVLIDNKCVDYDYDTCIVKLRFDEAMEVLEKQNLELKHKLELSEQNIKNLIKYLEELIEECFRSGDCRNLKLLEGTLDRVKEGKYE